MKSVLISIQPKWCEKIANGEKLVDVRKTRPKIETPFKCYIYCAKSKTMGDIILCKSKENSEFFGFNKVVGINKGFKEKEDIDLKSKVIGEFVCDYINEIEAVCNGYMFYAKVNGKADMFLNEKTQIDIGELWDYLSYSKGYGWHISDLVIYDKPKELSEFRRCHKCEYGPIERCNQHKFSCDGTYKITRAPQSWCYVEEVKE